MDSDCQEMEILSLSHGWGGVGRLQNHLLQEMESHRVTSENPQQAGQIYRLKMVHVKACSHQAKAQKITEKSEEIKEKISNIKDNFRFLLSLGVNGP